jgi:tRNA (guanine37-N1)-methyltransferase
MNYKIFTLHPGIFDSFWSESLIARGVSEGVISYDMINWREKYGIGSYKQVDDRPYGGGTGMVLRPEPIYQALHNHNSLGFTPPKVGKVNYLIPNFRFQNAYNDVKIKPRKVTVLLSARGYPFKQQTAEWLAESMDEISFVCGRYEGFDIRAHQYVDLELSLGQYVLNGGEVAAMTMIEAISRLVHGFISKTSSVDHDSFSKTQNDYREQEEYVIGKRRLEQLGDKISSANLKDGSANLNLFDKQRYFDRILPHIEHPHYTRPEEWMDMTVPEVLLSGDHKKIHDWRNNCFKNIV